MATLHFEVGILERLVAGYSPYEIRPLGHPPKSSELAQVRCLRGREREVPCSRRVEFERRVEHLCLLYANVPSHGCLLMFAV